MKQDPKPRRDEDVGRVAVHLHYEDDAIDTVIMRGALSEHQALRFAEALATQHLCAHVMVLGGEGERLAGFLVADAVSVSGLARKPHVCRWPVRVQADEIAASYVEIPLPALTTVAEAIRVSYGTHTRLHPPRLYAATLTAKAATQRVAQATRHVHHAPQHQPA